MLKMSKIKAGIGMVSIATLAVVATLMSCNIIHNAEVNAGGAGGTISYGGSGGGSCSGGFTWTGNGQHECKGAAWMKFNVGDSAAGGGTEQYKKDSENLQDIDKKCKDYGSYYRLGLARFKVANGKFVEYTGQVAYFKQVQQTTLGGGSINYAGNSPGALKWDEVKSNFETAKDRLGKESNPSQDTKDFLNQSWGETSWFCWNDSWTSSSTKSNFNAWSWVEDASTSPKPDSKVNITKTTSEKSVTVNFKHQLSYNRPASDFSGSSFAGVSTNWNTVVTQDGQPVGINSSGTYSLPSGYPNDGASWSPFYGQSTYTVNIPEGVTDYSTTVCSTINYNPKNISWKEASSKKFEIDSSNGNADSQACITIKVSETDEETEDGGQIRFWSTSTVQTPAQNGDVNLREVSSSSDGNGKVTLKLSTDSDRLNVNFWHTLYYKHESRGRSTMPSEPHSGQDKLLDDICTTYDINQSGTAQNATQTKESNEQYCVEKDSFATNMTSSGKIVKDEKKYNFDIKNIGVGQTVTVCQKISFQPEIITMTRTKKMKKVFDGYERVWAFDSKTMSKDEMFIQSWSGFVPVGFDLLTDAWGNWAYTLDGYPMMNLEGIALYAKISADEIVPVYYAKYHEELDYYEYHKESEQGDGYSEACVEVTRPADPTKPGDNGTLGPYSGQTNSSFLYAGESTSDIGWNVEATAYKTRRLIGAQAILFDPTVFNSFNPNAVKGTIGQTPSRTSSNPCAMYQGRFSLRSGCNVISNEQTNIPGGGIPGNQENVTEIKKKINFANVFTITDFVGDKYCNSFGFFWQYWYGVRQERDGQLISESWNPENQPYWTNYDAACRTIVKKPSTSIWNGGLFTNGDVKTSLSNRYLTPRFADTNGTDSGNRYKFGSWTEYLAVVGGNVATSSTETNDALGSIVGGGSMQKFGFASGSALGYNGSPANNDLLANSPLTIANTGSPVGNSGIGSNSTFRARLSSYLKEKSTQTDLSLLQNVTETKIVQIDHSVDITSNITVQDVDANGMPYKTIYDLPQIIIFVDGNINISSEVDRIDAWLISTDTINTCSEFKKGDENNQRGTEAYVSRYNSGTDCSKQLTINGPIIAKNVIPNRSAGADPITYGVDGRVDGDARATSGEVFNLSADTYLWAYAQAGRYDSSYSEAYTRELPPRY